MKLKAELRTKKGKSGARSLRREQKIPAILYGHGEESTLLTVNDKDVKLLKGAEHFTLDFGKQKDVIIKNVQFHPTTSRILHMDFQHLRKGESVKIKVSIIIEGAEVIAKQGGILEQILQEVEIECLPKDIFSEIKIDASELKIGDSIHIKDLPAIKGKFITAIESTVITVFAPKVVDDKPDTDELFEEGEEGVGEEEQKEETDKAKSEAKN